MSRELRSRLESAQARVKTLRESLPSMSEPAPLPEDLAAIERLSSQVSALEPELASEGERLARAKAERDELERQLLREEPRASITQPGGVVASVLAIPLTIGVMAWWFDQEWGRLAIAAAVPFVVSAWWLLRGAWRAGRASGARGPG